MPTTSRFFSSPPALIALLAVIKGYYLFRFGPLADSSDLPHYFHYATLILGDQDWLSDAGLDDYHRQTTLLRMIGYPLIIAGARLISPDQWIWLVIVLQIILSLYACLWVWRLGVAVSGQRWVGFVAGLSLGTGLSLRFDQMILTDSPTASLVIIAYSILSIAIITRTKVSLAQALSVGILIAAAFLLRDSMRAVAFFYVPLILIAVWQIRPLWAGALRTALMLGPMLAVMISYQLWNEMRTGERFITTIPHSGFLISMMDATAHGTNIFADDTPLDRVAREEFKDFQFREVLFVVQRLQIDYGLSEPQVMWLVQAKYKQAWLNHPGAMLREFLSQISPRQMLYVISPLFSDLDLRTRTQGLSEKRPSSAGEMLRSLLNEGSAQSYGMLALYAVQAGVSIIITAVFFIYPLLLGGQAIRAGRMPDRRTQVLIALWLFYWGMVALVALTTYIPRYFIPVMPIIAIIGFTGLGRFVRFYRTTLAPR